MYTKQNCIIFPYRVKKDALNKLIIFFQHTWYQLLTIMFSLPFWERDVKNERKKEIISEYINNPLKKSMLITWRHRILDKSKHTQLNVTCIFVFVLLKNDAKCLHLNINPLYFTAQSHRAQCDTNMINNAIKS